MWQVIILCCTFVVKISFQFMAHILLIVEVGKAIKMIIVTNLFTCNDAGVVKRQNSQSEF